jgi:hypothetical protein
MFGGGVGDEVGDTVGDGVVAAATALCPPPPQAVRDKAVASTAVVAA